LADAQTRNAAESVVVGEAADDKLGNGSAEQITLDERRSSAPLPKVKKYGRFFLAPLSNIVMMVYP